MALLVHHALAQKQHLLVEAGTGVGKSLAYLLPVSYWCLTTGKRAIVSTYTVNLQQQLVNKDIPLVAQMLRAGADNPGTLNYALFKGRGHYLCLRKWNRVYEDTLSRLQLMQADEDDKALEMLSQVIHDGTWDGDRDRLPFHVSNRLWGELCSESMRCMSGKCPFRESCFYQRHRRYLDTSHLIVVNHALFAANLRIYDDTSGRSSILPGYEAVVFDEAHHLEAVFRDSMTFNVGHNHLRRLSDDTLRFISREPLSKLVDRQRAQLQSALAQVLALMDMALAALSPDLLYNEAAHKGNAALYPGRDKYRLEQPGSIDGRIPESLRNLSEVIADWSDLDLSDEDRFEVNALARRYMEMAQLLDNLNALEGDGESYVYWSEMEGRGRHKYVTLNGAPLEVGPYLAENLWTAVPTAVLTSATLSTGGSFDYIRRQLEIEAEEAVIDSPFDYYNQACLCIPKDKRGNQPNSPAYDDYVAEMVLDIVDLAQGRTFVLFTSKKSLEAVSDKIRDRIEEKGYPVYVQGDMPRQTLLKEFKGSGNAVLMGLDSFWEGVDIPGEALSCVVLAKLPFPVPEDPVMEARETLWRAQGLNPFTHYSLPIATLKLKQGFGRLIRSKTDRGAVVILDTRILARPYGVSILKSLPPARLTHDLSDIARAIAPAD
jgi:ATP-dependent DNA helicase DinG